MKPQLNCKNIRLWLHNIDINKPRYKHAKQPVQFVKNKYRKTIRNLEEPAMFEKFANKIPKICIIDVNVPPGGTSTH